MNKIFVKVYKSSFVTSLCLILLGIFLLLKPETTISLISYLLGLFVGIIGISGIVKHFKNKNQTFNLDLSYGIICLIISMILIFNTKALASIIPSIIGIFIIINSTMKIQYTMLFKKQSNTIWISTLVLSIITLLCGIILIFNPFGSAIVVTKLIGIFIIVYSISDLIECYLIKKNLNKDIFIIK